MDVGNLLMKVSDNLSVRRAFGTAYEKDDMLIIPVALVAGGGGGGFGGLVLPSGAYVVKDGQVRWVPAVDVTLVVLASLSLVRVLARTWTRSRRRRGGRS